jgi:hypothetical protein
MRFHGNVQTSIVPTRSHIVVQFHKVLSQLLTDAYWGELDFLFLDLPSGTGDWLFH